MEAVGDSPSYFEVMTAMALLHFLWQGLLVGMVAGLALSLLRNARPQVRYAVACLALAACVLLPAWTVVQAFSSGVAPGRARRTCSRSA